MAAPTELEHIIMGVVFLKQPCTPYAVRAVFRGSLSARWTSSAGSIYPAMERLHRQGLLTTRARRGDGRNARLYRLSAKGNRALQTWLAPPLPDASELIPNDPLRVRLRFLGALPKPKARATIREARSKLKALRDETKRQAQLSHRSGNLFQALTHRAAELTIDAQLQWLAEASAALKKS